MDSMAVESTALAVVAYDESQGALQLVFRGGAIYQYWGVAAEIHKELLGAESKGSYFNRFIRGRFPYRLLVHPAAGTGTAVGAEGARQGWPWLAP
jgi:hypothetical protein